MVQWVGCRNGYGTKSFDSHSFHPRVYHPRSMKFYSEKEIQRVSFLVVLVSKTHKFSVFPIMCPKLKMISSLVYHPRSMKFYSEKEIQRVSFLVVLVSKTHKFSVFPIMCPKLKMISSLTIIIEHFLSHPHQAVHFQIISLSLQYVNF